MNKADLTKCLEVMDWVQAMPDSTSIDKVPVYSNDNHIADVVQTEPVAKTVGFTNSETNKQWEVVQR